MRRRAWVSLSLIVTAAATGAIMIAGGYYENPSLLALQLPMLGVPIAAPLLVAGLQRRRTLWLLISVILAAGWSYVVYIDTRPDQGGGASLAVIIGWITSGLALCVAIAWFGVARIAAPSTDFRPRRSPIHSKRG